MKQTYNEAMDKVLKDEGGYTNDRADPGGPTNWGITIHDARMYWKPNATATDVRKMPKSVAMDIYAKHYANPVHYDDLPPGTDYAVLDYGINSGVGRSNKVLQRLVGTTVDGVIGPKTLAATLKKDQVQLIKDIYTERLRFLKGLRTWSVFGKGWGRRVKEGQALALKLNAKYKNDFKPKAADVSAAAPAVVAGTTTGAVVVAANNTGYLNHWGEWALAIGGSLIAIALVVYLWRKYVHRV